MLRELIAALVVRRAIKLAELPRPEDAFRARYQEIPGRGAIDSDDASYYPELATTVLNSDDESPQKIGRVGMVAARLGAKSNRTKFANAFWFGDKGAKVTGFPGYSQVS